MHNDDPGTQVDISLKPINFERTRQKWSNFFGKSVKHWSKNQTYVKEKREDRVIYAQKSRKNPEKIIFIIFNMLVI